MFQIVCMRSNLAKGGRRPNPCVADQPCPATDVQCRYSPCSALGLSLRRNLSHAEQITTVSVHWIAFHSFVTRKLVRQRTGRLLALQAAMIAFELSSNSNPSSDLDEHNNCCIPKCARCAFMYLFQTHAVEVQPSSDNRLSQLFTQQCPEGCGNGTGMHRSTHGTWVANALPSPPPFPTVGCAEELDVSHNVFYRSEVLNLTIGFPSCNRVNIMVE